MILQVAATYQSDADEVLVEFRSTEDDATTTTVADKLVAYLYSSTKNLIGEKSRHLISTIELDSNYLTSEQNYVFKFRHPRVRADLILDVEAEYGSATYEKSVIVGDGGTTQSTMDLPNNITYTQDPFDLSLTQDGHDKPNDNIVILAPEIQEYVSVYDFTLPSPAENFTPLIYTGGGNRLFMSNQTNSFFLQQVESAPWVNSAYAFMEAETVNLLPNSFFNNSVSGTPNGYEIDGAGAMITQSVDTDYKTATGAKLWSVRLRQNNSLMAFNEATIALIDPVSVSDQDNYTFSVYLKIVGMTQRTIVSKLKLCITWFDGSSELGESISELAPADFKSLSLASITDISPIGATSAKVSVKFGSIDFGDDILCTVFAPQLERGIFSTSRTQGTRLQDEVVVPEYNAANQKIRFELIPGFSSDQDLLIADGPIRVSFTSGSMVEVEVGSHGTLQAPISFSAGDLVDLTIEHAAGSLVKIYVSGNLVGQQILPAFPATSDPLSIGGSGFELLRLSVFSRK